MTRPVDDEEAMKWWTDLIPDPSERARWRALYGHRFIAARWGYFHFDDPATAYAWLPTPFSGAHAAYLHRHGLDPTDLDTASAALTAYGTAAEETPNSRDHRDKAIRGALILVHPHLTRDDRDAIISADLTLDEVDHLVTTDTYNRDVLTMIGALT